MPVRYERHVAGENYVTRAPFGPVGRDLRRRIVLINLDAMRRAPIGKGRARDQWEPGYPPGRLKRSIHSEVVSLSRGLVGKVHADARRPGESTSYAASVHEGSESHDIIPRRKKWLRWPGEGGEDIFSKGVIHPGIRKPQPFMRDAIEAGRG